MDYDNFDIIIGGSQGSSNGNGPKLKRFPVTVVAPGRDPSLTSLTLAEGEDEEFKRRIKFNKDGYLAEPEDIEELGAELRRRLFPDDTIWGAFRDIRQKVNKIKGLRVRLYIDKQAAEISRLPWEYCFDDLDQQLYIGLDPHTPIVRAIPLGLERRVIPKKERLKVLVMVASPTNTKLAQLYDEPVLIEKHVKAIFDKLSKEIDATVIFHATGRMLREELRDNDYDIFQFLGHGMLVKRLGARLFFEKDGLKQDPITHDKVAQWMRNRVKVCLLTACESAEHDPGDMFSGLAQRLVQANIPAVIGMQVKVNHQAALNFTETFYRHLIARRPIDEALIAAREEAYADEDDPNSWGIPVLYLQAKDGHILPDKAAADAEKEAEGLALKQQATMDEPEEARPKEIDNLLEALSTLGFNHQRNTFRACHMGNRSLAVTLAGSENAEEYGLRWLVEVLRGELRTSTKKVVRLRPLTSQAFGSSADKLWRDVATSAKVEAGDADQVAQALVKQLDTHSLIFVVQYSSVEEEESPLDKKPRLNMKSLLDDFWSKIQKHAQQLPVPGGADQTMVLLLIIDELNELADYEHELLVPLPAIRPITESVLSKWHTAAGSMLPGNMQDEGVVEQILYGDDNGTGLLVTEGLLDDVLENIDHFCNGILEYIGK